MNADHDPAIVDLPTFTTQRGQENGAAGSIVESIEDYPSEAYAVTQFEWSNHDYQLFPTLETAGIELDQRMQEAVTVPINSVTAYLRSTNARWYDRLPPHRTYKPDNRPVAEEHVDEYVRSFFDRGLRGMPGNTFGTKDYLRGLLLTAMETPASDRRPQVLEDIAEHFSGNRSTDFRQIPAAMTLFERLSQSIDGSDDYQLTLAFDHDAQRYQFRISSVLDDFVQEGRDGIRVPYRALLALDHLGLFSSNAVKELEELINSLATKEADLQRFFERHSNFLRIWDHREVHPHVYLIRDDGGPLIPDFILTNAEAQKAMLVELKPAFSSRRSIICRQDNRHRFASLVMEAKSQLHTYRDWFENRDNRLRIKRQLAMEIYRPRMMVVIGRSSEFLDEVDRARLASQHPDIELVTYDEILASGKRRIATLHDTARIPRPGA